MSNFIKLTAADGHQLDAYLSLSSSAKGCIVVLHEIFGITDYIKKTCRYWSARGYHTLVPALYDRLTHNLVISYENYQEALDSRQKLGEVKNKDNITDFDLQLIDITSAITHLTSTYSLPIGIIGFCWGGTLSWIASARLKGISAVVAYSGTHIYKFRNEKPQCPLLMHCGEKDDLLTPLQVSEIKSMYPDLNVHYYPAGHAFCCDQWINYDASCAEMAHEQTELFLLQYLV